jgi:2-polyprenyl-3-methyl-5-hydroxy-6-metoxy-1,4-benzoquinol methylase
MTANLRDGYREGVWAAVPEGVAPPELELRRAFLLDRLQALAAAEGRPLRVLDVGCGEAQLTAAVAVEGHEVVGLDVAEEPLRRARTREPGLDLRCVAPNHEWPLPDAHFDVVWAGETIEHVLDTAAWLSELRRVLRSGGSLLLSTPAHGRLRLLALALSGRRFDAHFDPRSDHLRFYSSRMLVRLLEDFGFERIELRRAGGPPLARRTLLASAVRSRF